MYGKKTRSGRFGRFLGLAIVTTVAAMLTTPPEVSAQLGSRMGTDMDMSFEFDSILEDVMGPAESRNNRNNRGNRPAGAGSITSRGAGASDGVFGGGRNTRETVRSSISELRPQELVQQSRTPTVNRQRQEAIDRSTGMYAPRLRLSPELNNAVERTSAIDARNGDPRQWNHIAKRLERRFFGRSSYFDPDQGPDRIQLAYESGGTAILKGTVDEPRQREIAELVVRMSPGVRQVRNLLEVAPNSPTTPEAD